MAERAQETQNFDAKISRQRLDFVELPGGRGVQAILTVTLPDGIQRVYRADATAQEAADTMAVEGDFDVEGIFGDIAKAVGKVAKGAVKAVKSVASSKVFKLAGKGLLALAPALGPLAPAALAAGGAMTVTSNLVKARHAADRGNKKAAAVATAAAVAAAKKIAPKQSKALLKIASDKSRAANRVAGEMPKAKPKAKAKAKPIVRPSSSPGSALARGRQLSPTDLVRAARSGRVYVVQAS
jgi:hypothetical protein